MSAGQPPIEYALRSAGEFGDAIVQMSGVTYTPVDRFLLDQRRLHQGDYDPHKAPPQLNSIGNTKYVDFPYPFQNITNDSGMDGNVDGKIDRQSDMYNPSAEDSVPEHRSSTAPAVTGRTCLGGSGPLPQAQDGSVEGSDEASPEGRGTRGGSVADGCGDEFGLHRCAARDGSDLGLKMRGEKDGPTPPWSELKTKAGKERKRLPLACIACRRKKIRCSGEKPACKHCLKSRIPCVYKVTARKAAPRTDYMAMLDKRLKRMEERIIKIVPKEEHDPTAVTRAQVKPEIPGSTPVGKKRTVNEAFGQELETWSKTKSNENSGGEVSSSLLAQETEENRLLTDGVEAVPSQEIQDHLAEVFFENIYGQSYHLLHKPSFMRKLRAGTVPPVLILSVCAVSSRFSTHPKLNSSPEFLRGEAWAARARKIVMKRYDWPNITILTCLLLLGLHEFGTCYGGRSWALGGMAIRMAYALQLHKDLDHDPLNRKGKTKLSFIDREIRRRTMWACFLMDRFNSSGTDRPMFTKEETIKVQLPIAEKYFQLDIEGPTEDLQGRVPHPVSPATGQPSDAKANMGVAAYMIRSIALWGRIIVYLFQGGRESDGRTVWDPEAKFADLEKQVNVFISSLPNSLKYTLENLSIHDTDGLSNQFLFLHIAAQQNILFLNHIAIRGHPGGRPPKDAPTDFVAKTATKAFEAAKRISQLLRDAESYSVTAPFAGYCAFLSSTVQMTAAFSKDSATESAAKRNLATNVRYLSKMKMYWGMFHWTSERVKEQFRACADAARQGLMDGQSPTWIYHYGDWFDRYPHGVSQSDFEDSVIIVKEERGDDAVLEQKFDYHTVEEYVSTLSPANPDDREVARPTKRRSAKKSQGVTPPQRGTRQPNSTITNIAPGPLLQTSHVPSQPITQVYQPIGPANNAGMFGQPTYYGRELLVPPNPQGILPQLDRQLVFGAYAGMDPASLGTQHMLETAVWDMGMGMGMGGVGGSAANFTAEPTSAWFMPFNMEPPEIGQDKDIFGSFGTTNIDMGYGVGGDASRPGENSMGGANGT